MSDRNELDEKIAAMASGVSAPEHLRRRIVEELEARGAIGRMRSKRAWWVGAAVAASVLAALLLFRSSRPSGKSYVLILDTVTEDYSQMSPEKAAPLAAAYTRWTREIESRGRLKESYYLVSTRSTSGLDAVSGIVVIEADSLEEVEEIVKASPHIQRGGTISIRELARPP